jgi:hypothetical protein
MTQTYTHTVGDVTATITIQDHKSYRAVVQRGSEVLEDASCVNEFDGNEEAMRAEARALAAAYTR